MTVQSDLQKAKAAAQSALGTYSTFAQATQDQGAKQMFQQMAQDMQRHVQQIQSRIDTTANPNYQKQQQQQK